MKNGYCYMFNWGTALSKESKWGMKMEKATVLLMRRYLFLTGLQPCHVSPLGPTNTPVTPTRMQRFS